MKPIRILLLIAGLNLSNALAAQPTKSNPGTVEKTSQYNHESLIFKPKKTSTAIALSITGTLIPVTAGLLLRSTMADKPATFGNFRDALEIRLLSELMINVGIEGGPSSGNIYARDWGRGLSGIALRTTGLIFANSAEMPLGDAGVPIGWLMIGGSMVYNLMTVPVSVNRYNHRRKYAQLRVDPKINPWAENYGMKITIQFD